MVEEAVVESGGGRITHPGLGGRSKPVRLSEIGADAEERLPLSIGEFARVLGGGLVPGSVVLIGGDPGIGKSTLLLQVALEMAKQIPVLYVSGEESERQIKMRATRLLSLDKSKPDRSPREAKIPEGLLLVTETNLGIILEHVAELKPGLLILDSVQTTYLPELDSSAGSVSQVRETASRLRELAKASGLSVFLIGHVTKEGAIAGPRVLEHIVDTVLYLEGDRFQSYRLLRSVKNRFGATSEVGVFEMGEHGMCEVINPSEAIPGGANGERARVGNRGHHGRHPPAAGRDPGADQPDRLWESAPDAQWGGFQPPAAYCGCADPPAWDAYRRTGHFCQCGERDRDQ